MTSFKEQARYQWQLFLLAVSFFSRLPVPRDLPYSETRMNRAGRYFALVGLVIGVLCALVFALASTVFPNSVAVLLTFAFSLLLTGAFHEDGLADMADGIGGGMTVERRLEIMKDSRLGTYGVATLVITFLLKFVLWVELAEQHMLVEGIIVAYVVSRGFAATLIHDTPYVTDASGSKSKPLASQQSQMDVAVLMLVTILVACILGVMHALVILTVLTLFRAAFKRWLIARLGGFTGDCLGAAQQLNELIIYLVLLALTATL